MDVRFQRRHLADGAPTDRRSIAIRRADRCQPLQLRYARTCVVSLRLHRRHAAIPGVLSTSAASCSVPSLVSCFTPLPAAAAFSRSLTLSIVLPIHPPEPQSPSSLKRTSLLSPPIPMYTTLLKLPISTHNHLPPKITLPKYPVTLPNTRNHPPKLSKSPSQTPTTLHNSQSPSVHTQLPSNIPPIALSLVASSVISARLCLLPCHPAPSMSRLLRIPPSLPVTPPLSCLPASSDRSCRVNTQPQVSRRDARPTQAERGQQQQQSDSRPRVRHVGWRQPAGGRKVAVTAQREETWLPRSRGRLQRMEVV